MIEVCAHLGASVCLTKRVLALGLTAPSDATCMDAPRISVPGRPRILGLQLGRRTGVPGRPRILGLQLGRRTCLSPVAGVFFTSRASEKGLTTLLC